jgi:hypothetical protein
MQDKTDPPLEQFVSNAFQRFDAKLRAALPKTAPQLFKFLYGVATLPEHVLNVRAFPHFVLPYWISPARARVIDPEFQADIIYSTINGSYSIRLCDNIADNDSPPELKKFAPCAAYFDSEFIRPYVKYFPMPHDFWVLFDRYWTQQAEASCADSLLDDVDEEIFTTLSSRKFTAAKIPLAAVKFRYGELESSFEQWLEFVDLIGNFTQFNNDFFDWDHDSQYGITTYVSSEWKRHARGDSLADWFLREGFEWGAAELKTRFKNAKHRAEALRNKEVLDWMIARGHILDRDIVEARSGLALVKMFGTITSSKKY